MPRLGLRVAVALLVLPPALGMQSTSAVVSAASTACAANVISAGDGYSTAISNGQLFTWGFNAQGELGLGFQNTDVPTPTAVHGNPALTNVTGVWAGFITSFVVDPSGNLWTWGQNQNNQTGLGDFTVGGPIVVLTPTPVGGPTNVVSVGTSDDHSVAVTSGGAVWGWGQAPGLGLGDISAAIEAPRILPTPANVAKAVAGFRYTILLTSDGHLFGAGGDASGQLGLANSTFTFQQVPLTGIIDVSTSNSIGDPYTLALDGSGHVFAFGTNTLGELAQDPSTVSSSSTPLQVPGLDNVVQVSAGGRTAYALKSDGTLWSWGEGGQGALGTGSTANASVPGQVVFPAGTHIVRVSGGLQHAMAADSAGNLWTWGNDQFGALGTGVVSQTPQLTPVKITLAASCPGLPPPPNPPTITSVSPTFGPAEGGTTVTITGTSFSGAMSVQFGANQPLLTSCATSPIIYCFNIVDDAHITVLSPPHPPGQVDISVANAVGFTGPAPRDQYFYEGWLDPTPADRTAFDVPIGQSASFTLKALENGPLTIGHTALPPFVQCLDTANPGAPAQVDCTVTPTGSVVVPISFFDLADPNRFPPRTYIVGRGWYSAMGDSFASGDGNPQYITDSGGDTLADGCHRSAAAYAFQIAEALYGGQKRFVACGGAVISNIVLGKGGEASQLNALDTSVDVVTISVGGNDIGFADIAKACIVLGDPCIYLKSADFSSAIARIGNEANAGQILDPSTAPSSSTDPAYTLDNVYATIRSRAPNARILVVGYPDLLPASGPCLKIGMDANTVAWLNSLEATLNDTIQTEAERNGAEFVDLSTAFLGHDLCSLQSDVNYIVFDNTPVHPNVDGQAAMAAGVEAAIKAGAPGSQFLVGFNQTVTTTQAVTAGMGQATFSTTWPGSDVAMTLVAPSGRTITRATSAPDVYHLLGPTYEVFSKSNPEAGTWTVKMTGTNVSPDGELVRLNATQSPHVNLPPVASFSESTTNGTAPLTVAFDAAASHDPDGTIASYAWDFGDGTIGTGATISHTFTHPGNFAIRLIVSDDGGAQGFTESSVLVREPTILTISGATTADYHDEALMSATLTSALTGLPVPGASVNLQLTGPGGSQGCAATTDTNGIASCNLMIGLPPGAYTLSARFDQTDQYAAATTSTAFTVTTEETRLVYIGPQAAAAGGSTMFTAWLAEDGLTPIAGRTVTFTLGAGSSAQTCTATSDASGMASCSIVVAQGLGPTQLGIGFAGDNFYSSATLNTSVIVFAYAAGGTFAVGDQSGPTVTFWSARWATSNQLSGGSAPSDFKGFENSSGPPVCGAGWTTTPANSSSPPAAVPAYMAVIVSSQVAESEGLISGDTAHIVIVQVAPGYANDVGHPGTATVVATLC
ncbi:MAG TPA: PKD domain-containing protein [Candidatus Dormibacteraeota bacterium]|nr:PKD domain-containing protein [Candidatus Dormibacteraeota bacterium]